MNRDVRPGGIDLATTSSAMAGRTSGVAAAVRNSRMHPARDRGGNRRCGWSLVSGIGGDVRRRPVPGRRGRIGGIGRPAWWRCRASVRRTRPARHPGPRRCCPGAGCHPGGNRSADRSWSASRTNAALSNEIRWTEADSAVNRGQSRSATVVPGCGLVFRPPRPPSR